MAEIERRSLTRQPLPVEVFSRALDSPRQDMFVPVAVLQDVLEFGTAAENMSLIATDSGMVPTCMRLLQQYCVHSRIFGGNDYGVICVCLIALRVQVNLLESTGHTFDHNNNVSFEGPTSNLRTMEAALSNAIAAGYRNRRPDDPPDLFRTSVGLVHVPPVLTADQAERLLDYLHRERDLFLRARVSGTSDWAGWPFLFHALRERLVFRNNTKLALKLLDICFRFMAVKLENASEAVLLEHLVAKIMSGMSQTDVMLAPVSLLDGQEVTRAYINQFAGDSDSPTTEVSHAFFNWVTISLDATRADLVYEFLTTSINHLWMVMEAMRDGERIGYIQITHFMAFATDVIVHVQYVPPRLTS
ncbi:hypothetical protein FRC09_011898 [Ceratobasidium sp. 395]|nr:hypothetical protein FRC09_011898 [Ceratobasidium sp. 395]